MYELRKHAIFGQKLYYPSEQDSSKIESDVTLVTGNYVTWPQNIVVDKATPTISFLGKLLDPRDVDYYRIGYSKNNYANSQIIKSPFVIEKTLSSSLMGVVEAESISLIRMMQEEIVWEMTYPELLKYGDYRYSKWFQGVLEKLLETVPESLKIYLVTGKAPLFSETFTQTPEKGEPVKKRVFMSEGRGILQPNF